MDTLVTAIECWVETNIAFGPPSILLPHLPETRIGLTSWPLVVARPSLTPLALRIPLAQTVDTLRGQAIRKLIQKSVLIKDSADIRNIVNFPNFPSSSLETLFCLQTCTVGSDRFLGSEAT